VGWVLTLIDCLLSEYPLPAWTDRRGKLRGPDDWIIWRMPLKRCFALFSAIGPRYGVEPTGPTAVERAMIKAKRKVEDQWAKQAAAAKAEA
jgi:hypothetical protein